MQFLAITFQHCLGLGSFSTQTEEKLLACQDLEAKMELTERIEYLAIHTFCFY